MYNNKMQGLRQLMQRGAIESDILQYIRSQRNPSRYLQYYYQHANQSSHMINGQVLYFHIPEEAFRHLVKGHFYKDGDIKPIQEIVFETDHGSILSIGSLTKHWLPEHRNYVILGKSGGGRSVAFVEDQMSFDQLTAAHMEEIQQRCHELSMPDGYMTGYRESYVLPYGAAAWNHHVANESNLQRGGGDEGEGAMVNMTFVSQRP